MNHASLYGPVAMLLLYDMRVRGLSWAERGVLQTLYLAAAVAPDRQTVSLSGLAGEAPPATWKRALGADGADAVGRLAALGLLEVVPEGLRATLQAPVAEALSDPARRPPRAAATDAEASPQGPRAPARAEHNLREAFRRHKLKTAEERRAWLDTAAGQRVLTSNGLDLAVALEIVARTGVNPGRFTPRTAVTPAVTAITHGNHAGSHGDHAHGNHAAHGDRRGVTADEAFDPLTALQDAGAPHADLMGGGEVESGAAAFLVRARVQPAEVPLLAQALARPAAWWPKSSRETPRRVTLSDLAGFHSAEGYEFKPLSLLIAYVRAGAKKAPRGPEREPPPKPAPLDPAAAARIRAEMASLRSQEEPV